MSVSKKMFSPSQPIDYPHTSSPPPGLPPPPSSSSPGPPGPHGHPVSPGQSALQLSPSHILPSFLDTYGGSGGRQQPCDQPQPQGNKGEPQPTMLEPRFTFKQDPSESTQFSSPIHHPPSSYHSSLQSHQQSTFTTSTGALSIIFFEIHVLWSLRDMLK